MGRLVPRLCDWLLRRFAGDEPVREGGAVTWWAFSRLLKENDRLREERNDWMREARRGCS
jgi:hypothetical protein